MREYVLNKLFLEQDLKYKDFSKKLILETDNIIGVRIPIIRKIAKEIYLNSQEYLREKEEYFEEVMIKSFIISLLKIDEKERIKELKLHLPKITNWSLCDSLVSAIKIKQEERSLYWDFLKELLLNEKNTYTIRFVIVMFLRNFLNTKYIDEVINIVRKLKTNEYYINMAIYWLVAESAINFPEKIIEFLNDNNISSFIFTHSISKALESRRVNIKEELRELRKSKTF